MASPAVRDAAAAIRTLRSVRVVLDEDLAKLYGVTTKRLNQAVARNLARFPSDFMFRLTSDETRRLRSHIATSKSVRGGRRYPPRAFTEQGIAMLSGVLRSPTAIAVNIEIMRAFALLRRLERDQSELGRRIDDLEKRFDIRFRVVFDAIRVLQAPPVLPNSRRRSIGFRPNRGS
jgi:ORF6N domain-containing protein